MSIKVNIPAFLHQFTDGKSSVEVAGSNVNECLDSLIEQFPGIDTVLFSTQGELLSYVYISVNQSGSSPEQLTKPVKDGDELNINLLIIAGG